MGNDIENSEIKGKEVSDLDKYEILYRAYSDEIKNLWQRSIFLGAFITLAWGGYGALQLKFIDKVLDKSFGLGAYHYFSILICFVIIVCLCCGWLWQRARNSCRKHT